MGAHDNDFASMTRSLYAAGVRLDATLARLSSEDFTRLMASADRIETTIDDECARRAVEGYAEATLNMERAA